MVQMCDGENLDKFDKSKFYHQTFPCQYFAIEQKNLSTSM